ncbi:MAG: XdhC family protein [Ferruginibacter sp.]
MKEIKAIIQAYNQVDISTTRAALATVVRVEGSSYRRTGARMLITDDGTWVGGISGGCLEGDALKRARLAMAKSVSTLVTYDTTEDDAYQIGVGLGCNGVIDVLFTPLNFSDKNNPVELLKSCLLLNRQTHVLITITRLEGEWKSIKTGDVIIYEGAEDLQIFENDWFEDQFNQTIEQQIKTSKSAPHTHLFEDGREIEVFIEILLPEIKMVLMGNQYDIYPLCRLIKEIGWTASIVSNLQKINTQTAAIADEIIDPEKFDELLVDEYTVIILMSHDYKTDKKNLPKALTTSAPYIGMLGPRIRAEKIWAELEEEEGYKISPQNLQRIHAPIGLDIGAISPEEIALSLIAEVRASLSNRDGGFLRLRTKSIHERE